MNQISSENGSTLKMYDQPDVAPAWYKSLKKNVGKWLNYKIMWLNQYF